MNRNLLIVDDEREILDWLEELFRYEFDMDIGVYSASSAKAALELLDSVRFDVMLTDIKMPGMDGISLFERIKKNWPRCKTVFLTGYRNFEDVYRIINHRDVRYILKTEGDEVIMNAVRDSFAQIDQEAEADRRKQAADNQLKKAHFWMRRELMEQVCAGIAPEDLPARMASLGIEIDADKPVLPYLLRIDTQQQGHITMEQLIQIVRKNTPARLRRYVHMQDQQHALLMVQSVDEEPEWEQTDALTMGMLEYAQEDFATICGATFSAVAYPEAVALSDLLSILPKLRMAMNQFVGSAQEVICRELCLNRDDENESAAGSSARIPALLNLLELRRRSEYFDLLHLCMQDMMDRRSMHDPQALETYYSIAVRLLQFINENHLNEQIASKTSIYKLTNAAEHNDWRAAGQYLSDVSRYIFELLDGSESNLSRRLLSRVVTHIDEHLNEDLTLTRLAQVGGFNASYLSRLFKQMTGTGISEYILHKRMDLAKTLLADPNAKIQDVAAKTGYLSAHSFTRAFRQETGVPPKEWRVIAGKSKE